MTERYVKLEKTIGDSQIGEGAYGKVYKAVDTYTKMPVALKKTRLELEDEGIPATALREITLLRQLQHKNVIHLVDVLMEPGRLYLVFQLMDTDLRKLMDCCKEHLSPDLIKSYMIQLLEGLSYCHSMGVMHRDLKPQNLLVSRDGLLRIADFGLARAFTPPLKPLTVEVITRWYRAPEILLGNAAYTAGVDMWSVGCILGEMYNMSPLLPGDSEIGQLHKIFRLLGTPTVESWGDLASFPYWRNNFPEFPPLPLSEVLPSLCPLGSQFLMRMLVYKPGDRVCARDALSDPYIRSYRAAFRSSSNSNSKHSGSTGNHHSNGSTGNHSNCSTGNHHSNCSTGNQSHPMGVPLALPPSDLDWDMLSSGSTKEKDKKRKRDAEGEGEEEGGDAEADCGGGEVAAPQQRQQQDV